MSSLGCQHKTFQVVASIEEDGFSLMCLGDNVFGWLIDVERV